MIARRRRSKRFFLDLPTGLILPVELSASRLRDLDAFDDPEGLGDRLRRLSERTRKFLHDAEPATSPSGDEVLRKQDHLVAVYHGEDSAGEYFLNCLLLVRTVDERERAADALGLPTERGVVERLFQGYTGLIDGYAEDTVLEYLDAPSEPIRRSTPRQAPRTEPHQFRENGICSVCGMSHGLASHMGLLCTGGSAR